MPLADLNSAERVEIGDDWYLLRKDIGFYHNTIMLIDSVDPATLRGYELIDEESGLVTTASTPGEMVARRNFSKLKARLISWSHMNSSDENSFPLPLTLQNIQRILPDDAKILMDKITELEGSEPEPFPK